jgi:hypothetical protein
MCDNLIPGPAAACRIRQTHVPKHVWLSCNFRLHELHTKWAAEQAVRGHAILLEERNGLCLIFENIIREGYSLYVRCLYLELILTFVRFTNTMYKSGHYTDYSLLLLFRNSSIIPASHLGAPTRSLGLASEQVTLLQDLGFSRRSL